MLVYAFQQEEDFVKFMKDPLNSDPEPSQPPAPAPEEQWKDVEGYENIALLTVNTFEAFIKRHSTVLVMFYAPCKYQCRVSRPHRICFYIL